MQKGSKLKFSCPTCENELFFSLFELEKNPSVKCTTCQKSFTFQDKKLFEQLKKFESLCRQIHDSKEILGNASVGINIEGHCVKIPYKLLLTRFNSHLELVLGNEPLTITFLLEPKDEFSFPKN